jgi:hypothetical protein
MRLVSCGARQHKGRARLPGKSLARLKFLKSMEIAMRVVHPCRRALPEDDYARQYITWSTFFDDLISTAESERSRT